VRAAWAATVGSARQDGGVAARSRPLSLRALNRTLLARQSLLERRAIPLVRVLETVGGLQAQDPVAPLFGLLSRLDGFAAEQLARAVHERRVVRGTLMRGTVHLVSARDYLRLEPATGPLVRDLHRRYLRDRADLGDVSALAAEAMELASEPMSTAALQERFGDDGWWRIRREGRFLHAPVEGERSGFGRRALFVSADAWLGARPEASADAALELLVRRGIAGFGPMTLADLAAWSGLAAAKLRPAVEAMDLVERRDADGRALLDLPRRPVVDADAPAPPRLLAPFDNAILSHADRTRIIDDDARRTVIRGGIVDAVFLVDGFVRGRWRVARTKRAATLTLEAFGPIPRAHRGPLRDEAERTLAFAHPDADSRTVRGA
jgi:winged helix DNA-binding protein